MASIKRPTPTHIHSSPITVTFSEQQDGFGFFYGTALSPTGETWSLNVMPPAPHWKGDFKLDGYEPHPTDWVIYVGDKEVARTSHARDIQHVLVNKLIGTHPSCETERS